ncbi:MAG TPA: GntR family transcriptional regulator [Anaerolineales bacterium]|nr:GntR family transcriptional regulator [Anaerolineales bacterium]
MSANPLLITQLRIQLDAYLREPAYMQISEQIRALASTGRVQPGVQLPTVRQLARRLGVNFNTVARAYRLLVDEGLLSTQPGRGTFVLARRARFQSRQSALHALARNFVAQSRHMQFSDAQLMHAVQRELLRTTALASGDKHG